MPDARTKYQLAADKYRPEQVRTLFIAEAPPESGDRYFYFEHVNRGDSLWIELMKTCLTKRGFGEGWGKTSHERMRKHEWLERFQLNGYWLIDAVKVPISGTSSSRVRQIGSAFDELILEVNGIKPERIVLVKDTVHDALYGKFRIAGLPVVNDEPLPFPGSGHQLEFARKFRSDWL